MWPLVSMGPWSSDVGGGMSRKAPSRCQICGEEGSKGWDGGISY